MCKQVVVYIYLKMGIYEIKIKNEYLCKYCFEIYQQPLELVGAILA